MNLNQHITAQMDIDRPHGWTLEPGEEHRLLELISTDAIGIASELGELAHNVKYARMDESLDEVATEKIAAEAIDIIIYCLRILGHCGADAEGMMVAKRSFNSTRFEKYQR